jgi:hypothetical protein
LRLVADEPLADWRALRLDPEIEDDRIIGALMAQRLSDHVTYLVTDDLGPGLKCRARGIPIITPPAEYRHPDLMGEDEREVAELRRRISDYESRQPELRLEFVAAGVRGPRLEREIRHPQLAADQEIEDQIRKEEARLVRMGGAPATSLTVFGAIGADERERFQQEASTYLHDYGGYLRQRREYLRRTAFIVKLQCLLLNKGQATAEGIHTVLRVPDGPQVFDDDSLPRAPEPPSRPAAPRSQLEILQQGMRLPDLALSSMLSERALHSLDQVRGIRGESLAPKITEGGSYRVEFHVGELQHGFEIEFDPFYCVFPVAEAVASFSIGYEIHAKNLAVPTKGQLPVILTVVGGKIG